MTPLARALDGWREVLGTERVQIDAATLAHASRTTLPDAPSPVAVLRPTTRDDVVALVKVAAAHRVPLYPISRGRNWGYGDRAPVREGCALLDLSGLDRIVEVDEELGYAVVEPGVTQGQLATHLRELGGRWWMDATGSGLHASVLGNVVERGFGHSPLGDHFANTATVEVVLADGSVVQTGLGDLAPMRLAGSYRWGIGPVLDGLFSQSNLGIVTRATVWLNPQTSAYKAFVIRLADGEHFGALIDHLRPLRVAGTIQTPIHFANDLRVLSSKVSYPWERTGGAVPLPDDLRRELDARYRIPAWTAMGGLYGSRAEVWARGRAIRRACKGLAKVTFLPAWKLAALRRLAGSCPRVSALGELLDVAQPVFDLHRGVPSDYFLGSSRWRVRRWRRHLRPCRSSTSSRPRRAPVTFDRRRRCSRAGCQPRSGWCNCPGLPLARRRNRTPERR